MKRLDRHRLLGTNGQEGRRGDAARRTDARLDAIGNDCLICRNVVCGHMPDMSALPVMAQGRPRLLYRSQVAGKAPTSCYLNRRSSEKQREDRSTASDQQGYKKWEAS